MMVNRFLLLCVALPLCAGCGGTATVTGQVTFDGKPVERGQIAFLPLDDKGDLDSKVPVIGAGINKGKYAAKDVPVGKNKASIPADEIEGPSRPPGAAKPLMPPEAPNNLTVETNKPEQTADFPLKSPDKQPVEARKK